ncbi:hypothetical protein OPQ81_003598 [Rhizoctonia solani]|nr:hypothetical protein OPQ81_003598 [Rhizoctonia solani]
MGTIGYVGLLLLIVEGGLGTRLDILSERDNIILCLLVATSGICLPIGFSMLVLHFGYQYGLLESFVVGAALSATSLGTTIAVMSSFRFPAPTAGPQTEDSDGSPRSEIMDVGEPKPSASSKAERNIGETRAGTILMGAAVLDDVVGLVISGVVANLGSTNGESHLSAWVIARPIVSSTAILLVTALLAKYISPLFISLIFSQSTGGLSRSKWAYQLPNVALLFFVAVVSAYVTIAHYIGTSMLIGAFCAGSLMSHCWKVICAKAESDQVLHWSPHTSFERIAPVQNHVLAPLFFASIGAAIPVRSLFEATTAWRGILFSALMVAGKILPGAWLPVWAAVERRVRPRSSTRSVTPSWPAGLFVGLALVTRGEIGLLILNIAEAEGLVGKEAFAVGIWAVVLSTLIGPIGVGRLLQTRVASWVIGGTWGLRAS